MFNYSIFIFFSVELNLPVCKIRIFIIPYLKLLSMDGAGGEGLLVVNLENCISDTGIDI